MVNKKTVPRAKKLNSYHRILLSTLIASAVFISVFTVPCYPQMMQGIGRYGASFLQISPSARQVAMGDAFSGLQMMSTCCVTTSEAWDMLPNQCWELISITGLMIANRGLSVWHSQRFTEYLDSILPISMKERLSNLILFLIDLEQKLAVKMSGLPWVMALTLRFFKDKFLLVAP
jgi:hypothetical protein